MNAQTCIQVNDRIEMVPLSLEHKSRCVQMLDDPDLERFLLRVPFPYRNQDFDDFLTIVGAASAQHGHPVNYAICDAQDGFVGGFGYEQLQPEHSVEIGYWIGKPYWGRGIMTEVVSVACRYAIEKWKVVRITAHVFCDNGASVRVLEKNDFELEGKLRKKFRKQGRFIDAFLYAKVL